MHDADRMVRRHRCPPAPDYDGTIQHKLLGLHQIRYHVTIWPYGLTWNLLAAVMIAAGVVLMTGRAEVARSAIFRSGASPAG